MKITFEVNLIKVVLTYNFTYNVKYKGILTIKLWMR